MKKNLFQCTLSYLEIKNSYSVTPVCSRNFNKTNLDHFSIQEEVISNSINIAITRKGIPTQHSD